LPSYSYSEITEEKRVQEKIFKELQNKSLKRRKGQYYTPSFIIKYMFDNAIKLSMKVKFASVISSTHTIDFQRDIIEEKKPFLAEVLIKEILPNFFICDISTGWGAYLIYAFDYLFNLYRSALKLLEERDLLGNTEVMNYESINHYIITMIFGKNIYGSDLSADSLALAKIYLLERAFKYLACKEVFLPEPKLVQGNSLLKADIFPPKKQYHYKSLAYNLRSSKKINQEDIYWWTTKQMQINWEQEFPEVFSLGGFDIIIGNPPYINVKQLSLVERAYLSQAFSTYNSNGDISNVFWERCFDLVKEGGIVSLITPRYWLEGSYSNSLREFLLKNASVEEIIDFRSNRTIFSETENRLGVDTAIVTVRKKKVKEKAFEVYLSANNKPLTKIDKLYFKKLTVNQANLTRKKWILEKTSIINLIEILSDYRLGDDKKYKEFEGICEIGKGCSTGNNKIFSLKKVGDSEYVGAKNVKLYLEDFEELCLRRLIKNSDIQRFFWNKRDEYWLFLRDKKIEDFPNIKHYLDLFADKLNKTKQKYNLRNYYDYAAYRSLKLINTLPKIICPYQAEENRFALVCDDTKRTINETDVISIRIKEKYRSSFDYFYLLAVLNSDILHYYSLLMNKKVYNLYDFRTNQISSFPIIRSPNQKLFKVLVENIMQLKKLQSKYNNLKITEAYVLAIQLLNALVFETYFRTKTDSELIDVLQDYCCTFLSNKQITTNFKINLRKWREVFSESSFKKELDKIWSLPEVKEIINKVRFNS